MQKAPISTLPRALLQSSASSWAEKEISPEGAGAALPTVVLHQGLHLLLDALVPLGDIHVQRVVAAGLAVGPFPPLVEGSQQAGPRLGNHMVN